MDFLPYQSQGRIFATDQRELRLQELREGMRVRVLDLSMAEELNLDLQRELGQILDRTTI